jgi:hypothetical protein
MRVHAQRRGVHPLVTHRAHLQRLGAHGAQRRVLLRLHHVSAHVLLRVRGVLLGRRARLMLAPHAGSLASPRWEMISVRTGRVRPRGVVQAVEEHGVRVRRLL